MFFAVSSRRAMPYSGKHCGLVASSYCLVRSAVTGPFHGLPLLERKGLCRDGDLR